MARPSPSCAHDDDRLRLPAASPSRSDSAEKKESTGPRLSQLCPPYVTPSSSSSLEHHRSDTRIVENGSAASSAVSSAKVGLGGGVMAPTCNRSLGSPGWQGWRRLSRSSAAAGRCGSRACERRARNCSPRLLATGSLAILDVGRHDKDIAGWRSPCP